MCNQRVLLNNMSWTFIHVNKYKSTPFVMATYYSIVLMNHNLFNQFNGCLVCFQFGVIMNSSVIYSLGINLFPFCDYFLKVRLLDHTATTFYTFLLPECLLKSYIYLQFHHLCSKVQLPEVFTSTKLFGNR